MAPAELETTILCKMSGMRWPIEICFEDGKQLVGMGDYEVRGWLGWHHHMTMVSLAYFFLVKMKLKLKDKASALTIPQVRLLLIVVLPKREYDIEWAMEVTQYQQRRNHAAYLSHRKRRVQRVKQSHCSIEHGHSGGGIDPIAEVSL